jgi:flavodoxin
VVGSPTHGGRASENTKQFFDSLAKDSLTKVKAVAYDTGITVDGQNWFMRFVIRFFGYASGNIAKLPENKGAKVVATETFFVMSKEGPLVEGEIKRAEKWAEHILNTK